MSPTYTSQNLDHLGLVAGMYRAADRDELGIGRYLDEQIVQDQRMRQVSIGRAVKALVLKGFVNRALYLTPQFSLTSRPTRRWVFRFFAGIHRLLIDGQATVMMNLKAAQWTVIEVLGRRYRLIYGGGGGSGASG